MPGGRQSIAAIASLARCGSVVVGWRIEHDPASADGATRMSPSMSAEFQTRGVMTDDGVGVAVGSGEEGSRDCCVGLGDLTPVSGVAPEPVGAVASRPA